MKATIKHTKASSILHDGKFLDTGVPLDLPFTDVMRITRTSEVEAVYDRIPYDPSLWRDTKFLNFYGDINGFSGFGGVSRALIANADIKHALVGRVNDVRDRAIFTAQNRELNQAGAMVWHDQPRDQWLHSPFERNIAILPFETTRIPRSWLGKIAHFTALFAPCVQNIQMFRDSGVTLPIELIHWGVDPERYYPIERKPSEVFTFGHMGALSVRKGTDLLVKAFTEEFKREKDVRLICKSSHPNYPFVNGDDRIKVQLSTWSHEEMLRDFFAKIDCFVFPTRGEGFGLTPLEAMATGVPAIVTGWGGPMEYMTPDVGWLIDYEMKHADNFANIIYKEDCGDWAEPSLDHLKALMRYAYEHRDEVKAKGEAAAKHVSENWLWSQKIKMYEESLDKHL